MEVLADSAYGTGEMLAAVAAAGHTPVIKPWPLRPAVTGGFTLDDFSVDEAAGTVTCPNNVTRNISPKRNVTFGAACVGCPFRNRCTTARDGKSLTLHPHDALQREHRTRAQDPGFAETYRRHRPMVERSIAWLTRGSRRVPLPRRRQEQHLAHPAHGRAESAPDGQSRTCQHQRDLGQHLKSPRRAGRHWRPQHTPATAAPKAIPQTLPAPPRPTGNRHQPDARTAINPAPASTTGQIALCSAVS